MIELLTQPTSIAILVSGVIFYLLGSRSGYRRGLVDSAGVTVDILVDGGYLKYRETADGEKEFIKFKD